MALKKPILQLIREGARNASPSSAVGTVGQTASAGARKVQIAQAEARKAAKVEELRKGRRKWAAQNTNRPTFMQFTPYTSGGGNPRLVKAKNPFYRPASAAQPAAPVAPTPSIGQQVEDTPEVEAPIYEGGPTRSQLGLNLGDVFRPPPSVNPAALFAPSARLLERQRTDADAARQKAQTDLRAFNEWLTRSQQATQGGLSTELGRIGQQAAQTRSESLTRVNEAVQNAIMSSQSPDLLRTSGLGAQVASGVSGQLAQDAAAQSTSAVQAGLATRAADQSRVNAALAAGMPLELTRAYNERLRGLQDKETELAGQLAQLRFQDVQSRREFATQQTAQAIAARTAEAELGQKFSDQQIDIWKTKITEDTKRLIANKDRRLTALVEQGKLTEAQADRQLRSFTSKADRESREKIAILDTQTKIATTGEQTPIEADQLASSISGKIPVFALSETQKVQQQKAGATQFVKAARTRWGGQLPWTTVRNMIDTYFPEFSANETAVNQLRAYWGG